MSSYITKNPTNCKHFPLCSMFRNLLKKKKVFIIKKIEKFLWRDSNMAATILPSIFVPLVGLVFPAIVMASLFLYIEKDQVN